MKKVIYGVLLVAVFGLTACGNDKKETTASSKVEELESRIKELESSSSEETPTKGNEEAVLADLKSDTNRKIVKAFLEHDLSMYNNNKIGVFEADDTTMYFSEQNDATLYFTVSHFDSLDSLNNAYEEKKNGEYELFIAKNDSILALMIAEATPKSTESEKEFDKYKTAFENIQ